jgi:hypothetical protein
MRGQDNDVRKRKHLTPKEKYQTFIDSIVYATFQNFGLFLLTMVR